MAAKATSNQLSPATSSRLLTVRQFADRYFGGDETTARDVLASGAIPLVRPPSGRAPITGRTKRVWVDERDAEAAVESWKG